MNQKSKLTKSEFNDQNFFFKVIKSNSNDFRKKRFVNLINDKGERVTLKVVYCSNKGEGLLRTLPPYNKKERA